MKKIIILGGMSYESTADFYLKLNQEINKRLGGLNSADVIISSVNFAPIKELMDKDNWEAIYQEMTKRSLSGIADGAKGVVICTNTIHKIAESVQEAIAPNKLLHIADAVGKEAARLGLEKLALLGTAITMEETFYSKRLADLWGVKTIIPAFDQRRKINELIFSELCLGKFTDEGRSLLKSSIDGLMDQGAQGAILACTELPLLIKQENVSVPLFDTLQLHVIAAADFMLS